MISAAGVIDVGAFLDTRKVGRLQIRVLILCALVMVLDGLDTQVIGYLGPALARDWHLARASLSPVLTAGLAGLMGGLILIAPLSDRIGRKLTLVLSTALFGGFTLATAGAHGVGDLILYRIAAGIGLGGALPNALSMTSEYSPKRNRSTLVVLVICGFAFGSILGGGLTATLVARYGWRLVFTIGGVLPLLLTPLLLLALPESLAFLALKQPDSPALRKLVRSIDPSFEISPGTQFRSSERLIGVPVAHLFLDGRGLGTALLWVAFFMNLTDFYFLQSWLPTIFTSSGFSLETAALVATLISVGGIAAGLLAGPLMDRHGPYSILTGLYLLGTVCVFSVGVMSSLPGLIITTFCAGFCVSGGQKVVNTLAVEFYPTAMRSTGVGWALGIGRIGSIAGPAAGGWMLTQNWPNSRIFDLAAVPMLAGAAVIFWMGSRYREHRP